MKRRRYGLFDHEWSILSPPLPDKPRGVPRVDDRRFRTGSPWAEVSDRYGPPTTCHNRFVRWRKEGSTSPPHLVCGFMSRQPSISRSLLPSPLDPQPSRLRRLRGVSGDNDRDRFGGALDDEQQCARGRLRLFSVLFPVTRRADHEPYHSPKSGCVVSSEDNPSSPSDLNPRRHPRLVGP